MFGWFTPKCPLDTWEKTWTERRMRWLTDQLGAERLLRARVILPTEPCLAPPFGKDMKSVRRLLDHLCNYMGVPRDRVELEIIPDEQMPGAAGLYWKRRRSHIAVARSRLDDPERLLATLTHELAHEVLLGGGLLHAGVSDHEWVTDLLPVFLGLGISLANATIRDSSGHSGQFSWWSMSRTGYLPSRIFGYAFALFVFARGEADPPWVSHLRPDAAVPLHDGLRYLRKTGDSLFRPDTLHDKSQPPTPAEALERLRSGGPTLRLATLWDIRDHALTGGEILPAVLGCLDDRDPHILAEAAHTLAGFGSAAEESVPRLLDLLWNGNAKVKIGAAEALGAIGARPANVVTELAARLDDENPDVIRAVAGALRRFGAAAASAVPRLLQALKPALVAGEAEQVRVLMAALAAASSDPARQVHNHFTDPELRQLALEALPRQEG